MAYDETLADRARTILAGSPGVSEKKMFGGVAFLRHGAMFCGVTKDELMVRVGPDAHEGAIREPHVRPMDFTGKVMVGFVFVGPGAIRSDSELARWIDLGARFVATLPAKKVKPAKAKPVKAKPVKAKPVKAAEAKKRPAGAGPAARGARSKKG